MALDGIYLNLLCRELSRELCGARVEKLYQPSKTDIVLKMKNRSGSRNLLLSASGTSPRICITADSPENPMNPPMLCMLLRKHLVGAVLLSITQEGTDRIVYFDFDATNELGDRVKRRLTVEIMAQYSNIILLDGDGTIIDSVKRVDLLKSSVRQILPGLSYVLPPRQNKPSLLVTSSEEIIKSAIGKGGKLSGAILASAEGLSPLSCREIVYRAFAEDRRTETLTEADIIILEKKLDEFRDIIINEEIYPNIFCDESGKPTDFSFTRITQYGNLVTAREMPSLSAVLDSFYFERERLARTKARAEDLFKIVNSLIERTSRKISSQMTELEAAADRETKRIYAELISANIYRLPQGVTSYEVENYYDDGKIIKIPARPDLSPSQNSQRYFKEYAKLKTAEKVLTEQIEKGKTDLEYLRSVHDELCRSDSERELSAIRAELSESGFLRSKTGTKNKKVQPLPPLEYTSPDGFKILVGRNNIQNDKLTHKTASNRDIWFHTQKIHGSHVILVTDGREPTPQAMEYAAALAAYHSSARDSKLVPVDYTEVKNIKKPASAKPGFVIYHVYKTIIIDPFRP